MPTHPYQRAVLTRGSEAETVGDAPNMSWLLADAQHTGGVMNALRTTLGAGVDGPPPHLWDDELATRQGERRQFVPIPGGRP